MRVISLFCLLLVAQVSAHGQITTRTDAVGQKLNAWYAAGEAAGLQALSYENRDGGHSVFEAKNYPQLTIIQPTEEEWAQKKNVGPAGAVRKEPVFGNCSMAAPADKGGSLPRIYMLNPNGMKFLAAQYLANNLYFYPEHQDYDPGYNGRPGWGDMYPANFPFLFISQGSSFSDLPFMQVFYSAAAALPKETQQGLINNRLLIPVMQNLFRRSSNAVQNEEDYFTGKAHPPVFDASVINEERMIQMAHDMTPSRIPPLAVLNLVEEDKPQPGRDYFEGPAFQSEELGTTPFNIARVFRGNQGSRKLVVDAGKSQDVMQRKLTYRWALLQGDPDKVKIEPSTDGSRATITVNWHPGWELRPNFATHRVDIGVFASNGFTWSTPAMITFYMLPNEQRFYDSEGRLQEICYMAGNPDMGLPEINDFRWLALGRRLASSQDELGARLLKGHLEPKVVSRLAAVASELEPLQTSWRTLQSDPAMKAEAEKAQQMLQGKLQELLNQPVEGGNGSLIENLKAAFSKIADDPNLYVTHQKAVEAMLELLPETSRVEFSAARQQTMEMLCLARNASREYHLHYAPEKLARGEVYQLRQLNMALLTHVLFNDFLERNQPFAFANEMLTNAKPWRDIYNVNKDGEPLGWSRIAGGQVFQFNKDGQLLKDGKNPVPVKYSVDASTKRLNFAP